MNAFDDPGIASLCDCRNDPPVGTSRAEKVSHDALITRLPHFITRRTVKHLVRRRFECNCRDLLTHLSYLTYISRD